MEIQTIKIEDESFPDELKSIFDPPEILYVKGEIPEGRKIAVVGTRRMTSNGAKITTDLTTGLVEVGFVIISGMALGVDAAAHWAAIKGGGKTIAVLGAGVDIIYPRENTHLYNSILESGGAIISEIPPGKLVPVNKFAARNRIITGISESVIVTEANLKSGTMITVRMALEQGKDVFAVPGSPGTDYLIDQGAIIYPIAE